MNYDQYRDAVDKALDDHTWPEAYQPDATKVADRMGTDSLMEDGYEEMTVRSLYECAWELAWLDARQDGDTELEARARDVIVSELPGMYADQHPSVQERIQDVARKVSIGDSSRLQMNITANCEPVDWTTTS